MQKSGVRGFLASFCQHWFAVMSGGLSVPFSFFAVFFDNTNARISFAILAFAAVWLAAYKIWDSERRRVIELEEKLRPKIEFIALHEVFDTSNGFERRFELEIKNNSGTDLTNCLASVVEIHAEKKPLPDGTQASNWDFIYDGDLPRALTTKRNSERGGGGPFNLRPGQHKKVPLCSSDDGPKSDVRIYYEGNKPYYLHSIKRCEIAVEFYGSGTPTREKFELIVNEKGELKVSHIGKPQAV